MPTNPTSLMSKIRLVAVDHLCQMTCLLLWMNMTSLCRPIGSTRSKTLNSIARTKMNVMTSSLVYGALISLRKGGKAKCLEEDDNNARVSPISEYPTLYRSRKSFLHDRRPSHISTPPFPAKSSEVSFLRTHISHLRSHTPTHTQHNNGPKTGYNNARISFLIYARHDGN